MSNKKMEEENKRRLLKLARKVIEHYFKGEDFDLEKIPEELKEKRGVFVSLHEEGELRGCIGYIEPIKTIYEGVKENALRAAFKDPRFLPLTEEELGKVKIEISLLSKPKKIKFSSPQELLERLKPGEGVILKKGDFQATFLPQVWEMIPNKVIFLEQLSLKAGLRRESWKEAEIFVYQAEVFEEE